MCLLLLFALLIATADQTSLLKTFREEFVAVTPGEGKFPKGFTMGSDRKGERPPHEVVFGYRFEVAKYEVPQNLWESVMGVNPSRWKGERNSVELVSYDEAVAFCAKSTELMRAAELIEEDEEIRLPSEAEWEYVARAGTNAVYSFGNDAAELDQFGWSTHNAAGNDPPVGALKPNPWGLYDMHGYLWEWCSDNGHENYSEAPTDGTPRTKSGDKKKRVLRSGSWKDKSHKLTSTYRRIAPKDLRDDAVGLRCVLAKLKKSKVK